MAPIWRSVTNVIDGKTMVTLLGRYFEIFFRSLSDTLTATILVVLICFSIKVTSSRIISLPDVVEGFFCRVVAPDSGI